MLTLTVSAVILTDFISDLIGKLNFDQPKSDKNFEKVNLKQTAVRNYVSDKA